MHLNRRRDQQGIALILALMSLVVIAGIGLLLFTRTLNEITHSRDDARIVQTLMLARGGANIGNVVMSSSVADHLQEEVERTSRPGRWAYGNDQNPMTDDGPDPTSVANALNQIAIELQATVDAEVCGAPINIGDQGVVRLRVHFTNTACGQELPSSVTLPQGRFVSGVPRGGSEDPIQTYALPVVMISEGELGDFRRNVLIQGEYVFDVGQTSFAHYAYFTNRESASGSNIYFTDQTMIDGPTHTNGRFSFYRTPWFGGRVTSAGCNNADCIGNRSPGAYFYDRPSTILRPRDMSPNQGAPRRGNHAPTFEGGVQWQGTPVPLPTSAYSQRLVAQGVGRPADQGIYFDSDLFSLKMWSGNNAGTSVSSGATWQYIEACEGEREWVDRGSRRSSDWRYEFVGTCEQWRFNADGQLQHRVIPPSGAPPATWSTLPKMFNGVIFVDGRVESLAGPDRTNANNPATANPAIASFAQITIAAERDIRITRDLMYESPPCTGRPTRLSNGTVRRAQCDNLDARNVLGVYSQGGDIVIGNDNEYRRDRHSAWISDGLLNSPTNVNVHGVLMSATDQVRVEGYEENGSYKSDRGDFQLLGGMIQENRGVFGTFGTDSRGREVRRGYDRVYTYDPRMMRGMQPPFFPTTGLGEVNFTAFFSFGQREQVY